mmetsp:Transcript_13702/g.41711  ORF Transcript_13702/g.41711 Transcript_13702/m.41711 type:complete len:111 (-) Transcript_13702:146-478(-)
MRAKMPLLHSISSFLLWAQAFLSPCTLPPPIPPVLSKEEYSSSLAGLGRAKQPSSPLLPVAERGKHTCQLTTFHPIPHPFMNPSALWLSYSLYPLRHAHFAFPTPTPTLP